MDTHPSQDLEAQQIEYYKVIQDQLELWFQTSLGRTLLAHQRPIIEKRISRLFGFHQLELGVSHRIPVGNPSNLGHKVFILPKWEEDLPENVVVSNGHELAVEHDSADLVILHHALDFSPNPHQTLREAYRVLKSSGHLLIVGFNPLSFWGLRKALSRKKLGPWANRFISGKRVEDWLTLLDFKATSAKYHFYAPPFQRSGMINRFAWLDSVLNPKVPLGAYYTVLAQKQVGSALYKAPRWRRKKAPVVGMPLANRLSHEDDD